jgi:hypothetical protein
MRTIAVAVPVRNEAKRLSSMLRALASQKGGHDFCLCLFFDNCDDDSEAVASAIAPSLPFAVATARCDDRTPPNAGRARHSAMTLAMREAPDGLLLTTDADSEPRPDWVSANLSASQCADLVAGRIVWDPKPLLATQARLSAYLDRLHALRRLIDPVAWEDAGAHHWVSGASLAIPAEIYRELGGFPSIATGEDALFCDMTSRAGYRLRRDNRVVVKTSTRTRGRAEGGFAAMLARSTAGTLSPRVAHPEDETWRFQMQAEARRLHGTSDLSDLAAQLGLSLAEVRQVDLECRNGEAFAARIVGAPPHGLRSVGLEFAETVLSSLEVLDREGAA